ncbi:cytoskeleton protein RodZ [Chromohalobacter canadensis]|uniref:Cytoskeleton protein RodZ n=1 Tax=Chromohalobacter canadensis TaxID=141389 RepID=A0A285VLA3_9GAMM|nr:RodZ domain-containing protein [Chromohalobacter canadensis]SOC53371.1 cytoskeleton protein RodZ [Chromohalobacter canadensis]
MSDTHEQHVSPAPTEGHEPPGTRLRRERERQGLSLEEVAEQLNLRPAVVTGLEEDRYDQVPIATYRRGYLRAYAKLLGLDDTRVAQDYDALHGRDDLDRKVTPPSYRSQPPSRIGAWVFKLVTLLIIVGLIGLTLMWWQSREGNEFFGLGDEPAAMESADGGNATEGSAGNVGSEAMANDATPSDDAQRDGVASQAATGEQDNASEQDNLPPLPDENDSLGLVDGDDASADDTSSDDTTNGDDVDVQGANIAASEPSVDTESATQGGDSDGASNVASADSANSMTLTFNEQSWTEIYDADDQRLMAGLQDPGTDTELQGTPPFRLTIGNASGVELRYRGENVDLSQHTGGNNVARFTLGE